MPMDYHGFLGWGVIFPHVDGEYTWQSAGVFVGVLLSALVISVGLVCPSPNGSKLKADI